MLENEPGLKTLVSATFRERLCQDALTQVEFHSPKAQIKAPKESLELAKLIKKLKVVFSESMRGSTPKSIDAGVLKRKPTMRRQ